MKTDLISRRSFLSVVGAVGAAAALTACGGAASSTASSAAASSEAASSEAAGESVELIVFAAASLTETLNASPKTTLPRTRASPSASTLIPPVLSRPRSRRVLTATSSSPPVRSR